jgi:hypothetical protein
MVRILVLFFLKSEQFEGKANRESGVVLLKSRQTDVDGSLSIF